MKILNGKITDNPLYAFIFACGLILATLIIMEGNSKIEIKTAELKLTGHAKNTIEVQCITKDDIDFEYVTKCVIAEAGTEPEETKRLVADCIFNQSENFNMTTTEVINKPRNFEVVSKKMINGAEITDEDIELVKQEYTDRTNLEVLFFRTDFYHKFGKPLKKIRNMYFSTE